MATYIELKQQIEELQKEAEALRERERQGVIDRMKEAIPVYDITAQELGFTVRGAGPGSRAGARKGVAKAKPAPQSGATTPAYADANGNTWGGRGPRPKWLKEALAGGASLEDFAQR